MCSTNRRWWFRCNKMTIYCESNDQDIIVLAAPIVSKFIGQHIKNLVGWMKKLGGFRFHEYKINMAEEERIEKQNRVNKIAKLIEKE